MAVQGFWGEFWPKFGPPKNTFAHRTSPHLSDSGFSRDQPTLRLRPVFALMPSKSLDPAATAEEVWKRVNLGRMKLQEGDQPALAAVLDFGSVQQRPDGTFMFRCICSGQPGGRLTDGILKLARIREISDHVRGKPDNHLSILRCTPMGSICLQRLTLLLLIAVSTSLRHGRNRNQGTES